MISFAGQIRRIILILLSHLSISVIFLYDLLYMNFLRLPPESAFLTAFSHVISRLFTSDVFYSDIYKQNLTFTSNVRYLVPNILSSVRSCFFHIILISLLPSLRFCTPFCCMQFHNKRLFSFLPGRTHIHSLYPVSVLTLFEPFLPHVLHPHTLLQ